VALVAVDLSAHSLQARVPVILKQNAERLIEVGFTEHQVHISIIFNSDHFKYVLLICRIR
jgi:hypothetical protein